VPEPAIPPLSTHAMPSSWSPFVPINVPPPDYILHLTDGSIFSVIRFNAGETRFPDRSAPPPLFGGVELEVVHWDRDFLSKDEERPGGFLFSNKPGDSTVVTITITRLSRIHGTLEYPNPRHLPRSQIACFGCRRDNFQDEIRKPRS
jgi:hypothetical protein